MEAAQMVIYTVLCAGLITSLMALVHMNKEWKEDKLAWEKEISNWEKAQDVFLEQSIEQQLDLRDVHAKRIELLKENHEDELADMEQSCQERERYEQNKYRQLNDAFKQLQIKYDIERSRNRKLRTGFSVEDTCRAVDIAKGVRVS